MPESYPDNMKKDFANDQLAHWQIAEKYGKSWDWVQRNRSRWRRANGYPPLKMGPKSAEPTPIEVERIENEDALVRIENKLDEILTILRGVNEQ